MYELEAYETLTSPPYHERLNNPTPWSIKMMPHHRNMVRSQCRIVESCGGGVGGFTMTVCLSPQHGQHDALRKHLRNTLREVATLPGITGVHLLETDTPKADLTEEQKIRGGDAVADWIVLLAGYDPQAILGLASGEFADPFLTTAGTLPNHRLSLYRLSYMMTPNDF
jgi:hypothetical protein